MKCPKCGYEDNAPHRRRCLICDALLMPPELGEGDKTENTSLLEETDEPVNTEQPEHDTSQQTLEQHSSEMEVQRVMEQQIVPPEEQEDCLPTPPSMAQIVSSEHKRRRVIHDYGDTPKVQPYTDEPSDNGYDDAPTEAEDGPEQNSRSGGLLNTILMLVVAITSILVGALLYSALLHK